MLWLLLLLLFGKPGWVETLEALQLVTTDEVDTALFILCHDQYLLLTFGPVAVIVVASCTRFILAIAVCIFVISVERYMLLDCLSEVISLKVSSTKYMVTYH